MIVYDFKKLDPIPACGIPQNTDDWYYARRGRITASKRFYTLLSGRDTTIARMLDDMAEELHHPPVDQPYRGKACEHGHEFEEQAINEYAMMRMSGGEVVATPGMFAHPKYDFIAATPDFFDGADTTGQIKCPLKRKNHLDLMLHGVQTVSKKYYVQVQAESYVTGRPNIVFVSYHPDFPPSKQVYIEYVPLDEEMHEKFDKKIADVQHMLVNNIRPGADQGEVDQFGLPKIF